MLNLSKMTTESRNPTTNKLDEMSSLEIVTKMNQEDHQVLIAIESQLTYIATIIDEVANAFRKGGRLIYIGAGTSGRIGLLDAVECPPTFGVDPNQVIGLIAGGEKAFIKAVEGAEDNQELGKQDLLDIFCEKRDIVIGIAASGRTPYVIGGLEYAQSLGCKTYSISNNQNALIAKGVEIAVELLVGPEVLTGSTRLKSGTSQKMVCNMITTGAMIRIGKVYQNLMVDVQQTNEKLEVRAQNIVMEAAGVTREVAKNSLNLAQGSVKYAIVMLMLDCEMEEAIKHLEKGKGHIKDALEKEKENE